MRREAAPATCGSETSDTWSRHSGSRLPELAEARGQCKPYQVRQVLQLMDRYNLTVDAE
jgi:hypothetical protein